MAGSRTASWHVFVTGEQEKQLENDGYTIGNPRGKR